MTPTSALLITIEYYLDVSKDDAWNKMALTDAQAALAELKQRIADLESENELLQLESAELKKALETYQEVIALVNKAFRPGIIES